ncbi:MAG: hypothetical protein V4649_08180 [Bacteroidota bacterium]
MKQARYFIIGLIALLLAAGDSKAAFVIRTGHTPVSNEVVLPAASAMAPAAATAATISEHMPVTKVAHKKQSLLSRLVHKAALQVARVPMWLYIVLALVPFGGVVAMGINDGWADNEWIICLLLYLLAYVPGVIYTLVMAKKYYR